MVKKKVAIIPARGGSKRVPGKNIIDFIGKPMIAWTIEAALESELFDKVIVSTDDDKIAQISKEWGAEVPFIRTEKADDNAPVSEATVSTLKQLKENGQEFDVVVQLFAVCPLRNSQDIVNAYSFFIEKQRPFLISCYRYAWMNPWWAATLNNKNEPKFIFNKADKRSQDLPELYSPTGAIWIANVENLIKENTFYGEGHIFWEIDWKKAVDIDNYEDIVLAKALKMAKTS